MKTILVPTDFSAPSYHAALYALQLGNQLQATKLILYNACEQPMPTDMNMGPINFIGVDQTVEASKVALEKFKNKMLAESPSAIPIETISEYTVLSHNLHELCEAIQADVIVMGVTGGGKLQETLVGSNAIHVARHAEVPVIIIPPGTVFTPIKKVLFACDFKKVVESTPITLLKKILDATHPQLLVLNIVYKERHVNPDTPFESMLLDTLLQGYNPEYHFTEDKDFIEGINNFALQHKVDLIITIPKKHGLLDSLFSKNHTKALAFHSHVPLLMIHEKN